MNRWSNGWLKQSRGQRSIIKRIKREISVNICKFEGILLKCTRHSKEIKNHRDSSNSNNNNNNNRLTCRWLSPSQCRIGEAVKKRRIAVVFLVMEIFWRIIIIIVIGRVQREINKIRRIIIVAFFHKLCWQAVVVMIIKTRGCHKTLIAEEMVSTLTLATLPIRD